MICPFDQSTGRAQPAHIIDVSTKDGLLDMIALGNVIELSRALDQRHYTGYDIDDHEQDEIDAVMTRYRLFIRWYTQNFALLIQKDWISPSYLLKKAPRRLCQHSTAVRQGTRRSRTSDRHRAHAYIKSDAKTLVEAFLDPLA